MVYILSYPLLYLLLWSRNYLAAIDTSAPDSEGGIMIHAASVGEVNAVKPLISALIERYPQKKIVVTTTTLTGLKEVQKLGIEAHLAVLDLPRLRRKQLQSINPSLIIIVETEIWPNLLYEAKRCQLKVVFVNARMSAKSLHRYSKLKLLLRYLQTPVKGIFTQTEADAQRFRGLFQVPVQYVGNLKYALQLPKYDSAEIRSAWAYQEADFIICMGSSRPGEEALLQRILPALQEQIPRLKLIIAIRHPQRSAEVRNLFPGQRLYSEKSAEPQAAADVLIVDTIGHLNECYAICDLAIVGGSFYDFGGHNPLEPAFYSKAIIMGEFHRSCAESVANLARNKAIIISNPESLAADILSLFAKPDQRRKLGENAKSCLNQYSSYLDDYLLRLQEWL